MILWFNYNIYYMDKEYKKKSATNRKTLRISINL